MTVRSFVANHFSAASLLDEGFLDTATVGGETHRVMTATRRACGWVAQASVAADGRMAVGADAACTLTAVSVNVAMAFDPSARIGFLQRVAAAAAGSELPNIVQLPAGYFVARDKRALRALRDEVVGAIGPMLTNSTLIVGADAGRHEEAWVLSLTRDLTIARNETPAAGRVFDVGAMRAVVFVCGEVWDGAVCDFTSDELAGRNLLLVPSHRRVPGTVAADRPSPRWRHQRSLEAFAVRGAGILTHHHDGAEVAGRARNDADSAWIIFRGGSWLPSTTGIAELGCDPH